MSFASELASRRLRELVVALVEEHGSRSAVARKLGLSPSYVAKITRGESHVARESTVVDVATRLRLPRAFFENASVPVVRWRDHQDAGTHAYREMVAAMMNVDPGDMEALEIADGLSVSEYAALLAERSMVGPRPTPGMYRFLARKVLESRALLLVKRVLADDASAVDVESFGSSLAGTLAHDSDPLELKSRKL